MIQRRNRSAPHLFRGIDMKLFVAGVSHKTAPVEVREQLAVTPSHLVDAAEVLKLFGYLDEAVLLSTCNRVEIYGTTRQSIDSIKSALQLLSSEPVDLDPYIYVHKDAEAARHLFRVTAGLDSMTLGETEITGQIKNAYETAREAGLTGPVLNRLFQRAFQATKEIRTHTAIGRGAVSVKSAAILLTEKIFGHEIAHKSVMVIGAGQMAERCVESLVRKGAQAREQELATCHQIIEAHVAALIKKLASESERMTRSDLFRRSLEATRDISYPLPTTSGLVAQPS